MAHMGKREENLQSAQHLRKGKTPQTNKVNATEAGKIKSPSDTTIYAPTLMQRNNGNIYDNMVNRNLFHQKVIDNDNSIIADKERGKTGEGRTPVRAETRDNLEGESYSRCEGEIHPTTSNAHPSDQLIINAEKFKASVERPKGMLPDKSFDLCELKQWLCEAEDDEFFHVSCHIEPALKAKIEAGGFVDLNKLLPKNRFQALNDEQRMSFITKNGESYLVPADSDVKINGVRRWEQAFRVYAAIYSKAQPHCSSEIWQYVHVINTAAASYNWENVAYYDFTFRHLMAEKPQRSWARTYTQLWNLAMCEPINKPRSHADIASPSSDKQGRKNNWQDRCCWRFNRGATCKRCRFDHRCNYCGSYSHGSFECPKKKGKKDYNYSRDDRNRYTSPKDLPHKRGVKRHK